MAKQFCVSTKASRDAVKPLFGKQKVAAKH
jgi:hypothetical protein